MTHQESIGLVCARGARSKALTTYLAVTTRPAGVVVLLIAMLTFAGCGLGSSDNATVEAIEQSSEALHGNCSLALASVRLLPATVQGGLAIKGTVTLTTAAPAGGASVALTSGNADLAPVPSTVLVSAGMVSGSFSMTTRAVTSMTKVIITATLGTVSRTAILKITAPLPCFGVVCAPPNQCQASVRCSWTKPHCSYTMKPLGTACDDGNPNTEGDACNDGVCVGVDHCVGVTCPSELCRTATCDHGTGECSLANAPDGQGCDDGNPDTVNDVCVTGVCQGTCPSGLLCNGVCVNEQTDDGNCGGCGNPCTSGQHCSAGACVCDALSCANGCCNGPICTPYSSQSASACGTNGSACTSCPGNEMNATQKCDSGVCACKPYYADCNQDMSDGCEIYLWYDSKNCGACGRVCPPTIDTSGACGGTSAPGCARCDDLRYTVRRHYNCDLDNSNGCEVDGWNDDDNCGGCGNACPVGSICIAPGVCSQLFGPSLSF